MYFGQLTISQTHGRVKIMLYSKKKAFTQLSYGTELIVYMYHAHNVYFRHMDIFHMSGFRFGYIFYLSNHASCRWISIYWALAPVGISDVHGKPCRLSCMEKFCKSRSFVLVVQFTMNIYYCIMLFIVSNFNLYIGGRSSKWLCGRNKFFSLMAGEIHSSKSRRKIYP